MKTAFFPPIRVEPELRREVERLLDEGETVSSFTEQAIRELIDARRAQQLFIERGLAAAEEAKRTGDYVSAEEVLAKLDAIYERARAKKHGRRRRTKGK